jgi:hypothetical protein
MLITQMTEESKITLTAKLLERDHRFIEFGIIIHDHLLAISFADHQTGSTPTEIVHAPEGVYRQEEAVYRISDVDD